MIGLNLHTDICAFLITLAEKIFAEEKDDTMEAMAGREFEGFNNFLNSIDRYIEIPGRARKVQKD